MPDAIVEFYGSGSSFEQELVQPFATIGYGLLADAQSDSNLFWTEAQPCQQTNQETALADGRIQLS